MCMHVPSLCLHRIYWYSICQSESHDRAQFHVEGQLCKDINIGKSEALKVLLKEFAIITLAVYISQQIQINKQ